MTHGGCVTVFTLLLAQGASGALPFVFRVSEYLPLFENATYPAGGSAASGASFSMGTIYDLERPVCAGDKAFIERRDAAPAGFCMHGVGEQDVTHVIGSEWWWPWGSEVVQRWANAPSPVYGPDYDAALRREVKRAGGLPLKYDQFALERVMLGKWNEAALQQAAPPAHGPSSQPKHRLVSSVPDVVVVPSLMMHMQHLKWQDHLAWNLVVPKECVDHGNGQALPPQCSQGFGSLDAHRRYWTMVRKKHHAPYAQRPTVAGTKADGRRVPLVVVHHAFVWDQPMFLNVLWALLEQPRAFVDRVVVACVESNMKLPAFGLGPRRLAPGWRDGAAPELRARGALSGVTLGGSSSNGPALSTAPTAMEPGRPLVVTLPYPTGLGVAAQPAFAPPALAHPEHGPAHGAVGGGYDPWRPRPIAVLMDASLARTGGGGQAPRNWVRALLRGKLEERGATCAKDLCGLCAGGPCSVWPLVGGARVPTLWEALVSSTFCVEPAGDTVTRSHFYLAVLSGCVPVVLDGGLEDFDPRVPAWWAWRADDEGGAVGGADAGVADAGPFLRYSDFAVVLNASAVRDGTVDIVEHLLGMSQAALLALRRGLDRAAPAMRYAANLQGKSGEATDDAFARFGATLKQALAPSQLAR